MLLLGQEGLVSHLPGLICKKKKKFISFDVFFLFFFYLEGEKFYFRFERGKMCRYANKSLHVRYDTFGLSTIAREILGVCGKVGGVGNMATVIANVPKH